MKTHELADKFPLIADLDLSKLATSIKTDGQQEPIVLLDGKILDGRNRFEACKLAKVKPVTRNFGDRETDGEDPIAFVIAHNLERRHLTDDQRVAIAVEFTGMERGRPKSENGNGESDNGSPAPLSIDAAAKKLNVSKAAVKRGVKVKKHASKELKKALKAGKVSLTKAAKVAKLPKAKQAKALTEPRQKAVTAKAKMQNALDAWWTENKTSLLEHPMCEPESMVRHFKKLIEKAL